MATGGCTSARSVLWYLIFCGCVVNFMVTTNINIAIVAMVRPRAANVTNVVAAAVTECRAVDVPVVNASDETSGLLLQKGFDNSTLQYDILTTEAPVNGSNQTVEESRFPWDEYEQGLVLGGFFWMHWLTQVPGGVLAQRFGTKMVYGLSNGIMAALCFVLPAAAHLDVRLVVAIRVLQGLIGGLVWPAMHNIIAKWIPPNERSTFVTAYTGGSIGVAVTFCGGGVLVAALGWPALFHVTGALGLIWFAAWWLLVYDTPAQHPRISQREKQYIAEALGPHVSTARPRTPWGPILRSGVLWLTVLVHWASNMGIFTLMTQTPSYFKYIHGWSISMTGMLSGVPHVCRTVFGYVFSRFGDWLIQTKRLSTTGVRKLATFVCCVVMGALTLALAFSGCSPATAAALVTLATAVSGGIAAGPLASFVDLSPNFAGILMGVSCTLSFTAAFISPLIVSVLTYNNQTTAQWRLVYVIVAVLLAVPGAVYVCFANSELQPWNSAGRVLPPAKELQPLDSGERNNEQPAVNGTA